MGLLSGLFGSSTPKRKKNLKKPKSNATTKQLENYVEKRTKQLQEKVKREQLKVAANQLYNAKPEDLMKGKKR